MQRTTEQRTTSQRSAGRNAPLLAPGAARQRNAVVVQLVDNHNQLDDAQRLGQLRVLARLAALFKARFVLALAAADDKHRDVGLRA